MVDTGTTYTGSTDDYSVIDDITIDGENTSIEIPEAGTKTYNLWTGTYALAILAGALTVGVLAGVTILDTGLKEYSQKLLFTSILFLGLWACLSAISIEFMFANVLTTIIWIALTIIYVVGLGTIMAEGE
jgi:hypothetical protein